MSSKEKAFESLLDKTNKNMERIIMERRKPIT